MRNETQQLVRWLTEQVLPRYRTHASIPGLPAGMWASFEALKANGEPNPALNLRVRVQARQIFVYCRAQKMGWASDVEPMVRGLAEFIGHYAVTECRSDGYVHLLKPDFSLADSKKDLYDHAFFTLAYGAIYDTFGDKNAHRKARRIIKWVNKEWAAANGGWQEGDYSAPWRRQNPHMHWLETFLFLYEASGKIEWAERAKTVFALFKQHFYEPKAQVLLEFFDSDWSVAPGAIGEAVEPGHMLEWVWLLRWYERLMDEDTSHYANALWHKALAIGLDSEGLVYDQVTADGRVTEATKRLWPMTELIKAGVSQARAGVEGAEAVAAKAIADLQRFYLTTAVPGIYLDKLGAANEVVDDGAPASTLYHLIGAAIEAQNYLNSPASSLS
ncbi:MAG TPA: AGE family epimerase/isomerase [Cellvibrionaceae bacterium]|nr:AGE family epimerase/isomerase [Cellvibrionaceae bacterium]HNG58590.1 AGE family epimerase/isomerase [Cellvibrionaceae bacterium]